MEGVVKGERVEEMVKGRGSGGNGEGGRDWWEW